MNFSKQPLHEAMLYSLLPENRVRCYLCARVCTIPSGGLGFCQVRKNESGKLYALTYGKVCSAAVDPITKKPLAHFHPGSSVLSVAAGGCNFQCHFCDNWMISQEKVIGTDLSPEDIVRATRDNDCHGISYTYTEPTIFFEYAYDTAKLAHQVGFFNTFVTNGYMTREAVHTIAPFLDAATVDFKGGADPEFYKRFSAVPSVDPIFASLLEMKRHGIHVEITNLVVPKIGDSLKRIRELATWIRNNLGKDTPFHLLRFHPQYKMTEPISTPISTLENACKIAHEIGLNYVYIGNVTGHPYEHTYCPNCRELVIKRNGFEIVRWNLTKNMQCPACGQSIPIKGPFEPVGSSHPRSLI